MNRRIIIIIILVFSAAQGFSQINQYGVSSLKNYPHGITKGSEQNWSITQDQRGVIYIGNDDKGILEYDGSEWRAIPVSNNSIVRSLVTAEDGTVYVGAVSEIGYLSPDKNGDLHYESLLPKLDTTYHRFTNIWKNYSVGGTIYFCSEKYIMIYDIESETFKVMNVYDHTLFCFYELGKLYCGAWLDGLVVLNGDSIVKAPGGEFYSEKNVFGLTEFDSETLLIGTPQDGLSLYNIKTGAINAKFAKEETNNYITENGITHLLNLPTGDFIVSTAAGGLVLVSRDGGIKEIISNTEGLYDQTIYYSYVNPNNYPYAPVWSALSLGVAKTEFNSPLTSFDTEFGFQGLIHDINTIDGRLFIGTSTGLYTTTTFDGKTKFVHVEEINTSVWSFLNFKLNTGQEVLIAITDGGIYQISKDGSVIPLYNKIRNSREPEGSTYWGYTMMQDPLKPNRIFLGRETSIHYIEYLNGSWIETYSLEKLDGTARSLAIDDEGNLWFGTPLAGIGRAHPDDTLSNPVYYGEEHGLQLSGNSVARIGNEVLFGTAKGIYRYNSINDIFEKDTIYNRYLPEGTNWIFSIHKDQEECIWISYENSKIGWRILYLEPEDNGYRAVSKPFFSLPSLSSTDAFYSEPDGSVWFPKSNVLYHYQKGYAIRDTTFCSLVRKVTVGPDSVIFNGAYPVSNKDAGYKLSRSQGKEFIPHIKHSENNIEFRWSSPYFDQEEEIEYSFFLDGFSKGWSEWEKVVYQDFTNLPHGPYNFRIKARNIYLDESEVDSFMFVIERPWYLSIVAFFAYLVMAVLIVYVIIVLYTRRLKNENIRLEGIIQDRTAEIRKQKEELTDSIEYASRIQMALLPPDEMLSKYNLDHFILFRPRDIVSGDFYWIGVKEEKIYIVAADCTGHGVPGAFMSMLGISFLDEIVIKSGVSETNEILDSLRQHVITSLRQTGKSMAESTKDGMDLAMISINEITKAVQYSGAYNPLYSVRELTAEEKELVRKGEELGLDRGDLYNETHILIQDKADQMPIGISEKDYKFSAKTIDQVGSTTLYLFSDGFVDQFGGPNGKKFMAKNFKKLLLEIQGLPMAKQREKLNQTLVDWMGNISQIDDVLVIGIKLG